MIVILWHDEASQQHVELEQLSPGFTPPVLYAKGRRVIFCPFRAAGQRRTDLNCQEHGPVQHPVQSALCVSERERKREKKKKERGGQCVWLR